MRDATVESTMTVRTRSPTSAVSPPVEVMPTPYCRMVSSTSSRGLTLVHFSAQLKPCLTQNAPYTPLNTPLNTL